MYGKVSQAVTATARDWSLYYAGLDGNLNVAISP